ncbi:MAG: glycosyltransferase family 2 protein [Bacteroidia bacterium]
MSATKKLAFVIPVFRNEGSITKTYNKVLENLPANYGYEFVFVNDGSDDGSLAEIMNIYNADKNVKVLSFSRNFGQVAAVIAGMRETDADATIILSADMQEPPDMLAKMVNEWENNFDIVICYRNQREDTWFANATSAVFYRLMRIANKKMPRGGFDFLLIGRNALDVLNQIDERNRFFQGDVLWLGFRTCFLPYNRLKREIGKSQWSFTKKLKYFIDGFLNTSYIPIRFMSFVGMLTALGGFLYAAVIVYARLVHQTPFKGWAPIMIILLILGGLIMLMLGIIGEYLWRVYDEVRKRPVYIVHEKHSHDKTADGAADKK